MFGGRVGTRFSLAFSFVAVGAAVAQGDFRNNLMPQPARLSVHSGSVPITPQLRVVVDGAQDLLLQRAADRMIYRLEQRTGMHFDKSSVDQTNGLIQIRVADHSLQRPAEGMDESYTLEVQNNAVNLSAQTDLGSIYGMETILQLVQSTGAGYFLPAVYISDAPRFPWRGLMLNCGRHFLPVATCYARSMQWQRSR